MKNQKIIKIEVENLEAKRNLKAFRKLEKLNTDEAHRAYVKAQKNYISVLKKFIKQNVADRASYSEMFERSATYCIENQLEAWWAYLEYPENQIKILNSMISEHEDKLLNPEEYIDEN
jgi:hypothetical protein